VIDAFSFALGGLGSLLALMFGRAVAYLLRRREPLLHVVSGVELPLPSDEGWKIKRTRLGRLLVHPNGVKVYVGRVGGPVISVDDLVLPRSWAAGSYRAAVKRAYMDRVAREGASRELLELDGDPRRVWDGKLQEAIMLRGHEAIAREKEGK
jgi:hypothetical protein